MTLVLKIRALVLKIADALSWLPAALARLTVGWVFVESGWGKLHNLERVVGFFRDLGIPAPEIQAPFAATVELVCGALLLVGLFSRLASVPLIVTMIVALATAKKGDINGVSDLFGLSEYLYIALLVWIGVAGPGPLSLDRLLVKRLGTEEAS